jgi:hypothetical protein
VHSAAVAPRRSRHVGRPRAPPAPRPSTRRPCARVPPGAAWRERADARAPRMRRV